MKHLTHKLARSLTLLSACCSSPPSHCGRGANSAADQWKFTAQPAATDSFTSAGGTFIVEHASPTTDAGKAVAGFAHISALFEMWDPPRFYLNHAQWHGFVMESVRQSDVDRYQAAQQQANELQGNRPPTRFAQAEAIERIASRASRIRTPPRSRQPCCCETTGGNPSAAAGASACRSGRWRSSPRFFPLSGC